MLKSLPPAANFFALLRHIEHTHPDKPLLGSSLRLRDDPVRLGQFPHLDFATQDFQRQETLKLGQARLVPKLYLQNFGLLGPNGALPLHYTEHAYTRVHHFSDPTFNEFLDIFHHRAYTLFYRAWAQAQPHIAFHRPLHNPFTQHLNSLLGHGAHTSWGREALPDHFRAGLASHFSRRSKTLEGLVQVVSACTGQAVRVHPFQPRWLQLVDSSARALLGRGAMLGTRVWCAQSRIRIDIGPMSFAAYQALLPATLGRAQLIQATHAYLGLEFDAVFFLHIRAAEVPQACLNGHAQLGRTAWLGAMHEHRHNNRHACVRVQCPAVPSHSSLLRSSV